MSNGAKKQINWVAVGIVALVLAFIAFGVFRACS